jgi:uncharacterized protein (DUF58 family)
VNEVRKPAHPEARTSEVQNSSQALTDILRQVKKIELRTRRLVSALAAGRYRSAFRGSGLEFDEVREYSSGDDVRNIDWNVTARAGRPFVKVFREERELTTVLLVDVSGSMRFGAIPGISVRAKLSLAAEAAAVVAVNALRNHDRIGLVSFSDRTECHLPARKGRSHALRLLREVLASGGTPRQTNLAHALDELRRVSKKRAVCFLISDFLDIGPDFAKALARTGSRHDVVGLRIADPAEATLPSGSAPLVVHDPEGDEQLVLANGRHARAAYASAYANARKNVDHIFRGAGCDLVDLDTTRSAITALQRFFSERRRRIHA